MVRLSAKFFLLKFWSWLWNTHSACLGRQLRHVSVCFIGDEGSIVTSSKFGKTVTLDQFIVNLRFAEKGHVSDILHMGSIKKFYPWNILQIDTVWR